MQIFVINLEKDHDRRESITRQLNELRLPFEFVPGVLGSALSAKELAECYDDKKARRYLCMSLVPAHIGCSVSHTNVYRQIIERNLPCALVLEDDVVLPPSLPQMLPRLRDALNMQRPEVVLLSPANGIFRSKQQRHVCEDHDLTPFESGYFTSSYILTNHAARALLKELYPVADTADCWNRMKAYKVVDIFAISPPLIQQNRDAFGSSTHEDTMNALKTLKMHGWRKAIFKMRRAFSKFIDALYAFVPKNPGSVRGNQFRCAYRQRRERPEMNGQYRQLAAPAS